jgi:hypothetical protein
MKRLWGVVLPEKTRMTALARKVGFKVSFERPDGRCRIDLDLHGPANHSPAR